MTLVRLLLALVAIAAASPVLGGDEQDCFQGQAPDLRIKGCSAFIQRNPNDSAGYHNRAVAYSQAGDIDKAIADYSKVIEIAPDNASAYDNRGRAYASLGDQAQAEQDQAKARELLARAIAQPDLLTPKANATGSTPKSAKKSPRTKAAPKNAGIFQEAPAGGFWSWLAPWGSGSDQPAGKAPKQ